MDLLNNLISRLRLAWLYRREYNRVLGELESYRNDELHDLHLDRADFPRVAEEAAEAYVARLASASVRGIGGLSALRLG